MNGEAFTRNQLIKTLAARGINATAVGGDNPTTVTIRFATSSDAAALDLLLATETEEHEEPEGWRVAPLANISGTCKVGELVTSYAKLHKLFGEPRNDGCTKISTEWTFKKAWSVATIYDWKATDRHAPGLPSVEEFRAQPSYTWVISANSAGVGQVFMEWLTSQLKEQK